MFFLACSCLLYSNGTILANNAAYGQPDTVLSALEALDKESLRSPFAESEYGRAGPDGDHVGQSNCGGSSPVQLSENNGFFGDGANAMPGQGYSNDLDCTWILKSVDCESPSDPCQRSVEVAFTRMRVWSGDFVRIYSQPQNACGSNDGKEELVAQLSGIYDETMLPPPFRAKGCLLISFQTDGSKYL